MGRYSTVSPKCFLASSCRLTALLTHNVTANKKGAPFRFTIGAGEVIKGWDIGIQGMSVGGERRIDVPAKMAYGSQAKPGIPSNSPLKFDVKMLSIN